MTQAPPIARRALPRVDTHAHVFARTLPLADGRRYAPGYDATLDAYRKLLDASDIGHAVLVQPSFLGTDNSYLLQALTTDRIRLRGVAVVSPDISEDELAQLNADGITGVRLNLVGRRSPTSARRATRRYGGGYRNSAGMSSCIGRRRTWRHSSPLCWMWACRSSSTILAALPWIAAPATAGSRTCWSLAVRVVYGSRFRAFTVARSPARISRAKPRTN